MRMTTLWHDLRYAIRVLRASPGFTLVSALVLAAGIGANSAIFTVVNAVLLRPLPYPHSEQLVRVWEHPPAHAHNSVSPLNFLDWSEQNQVFSGMAAIAGGSRTLSIAGGPAERIPGEAVTLAFFDVLGIKPVAGRTFSADDAQHRANVIVLSERLWRDRFGADPKLVGSAIPVDGEPFTVVGIVPASFQMLYKADLWTPFIPKRSPEQRRMHYLQVFGRLKAGTTLEQAKAGMTVVASNIARIAPETNKDWTVTLESLREAAVSDELRTTSLVLAGVVGFVLLMACANVANLLLARGAGRTREMAVRASLGGTRSRLVRQLLTESVALSTIGGAFGLALAWIFVRAAPAFIPAGTLPVSIGLDLDWTVIGFAVAVTAGTGVLFGLAPAWQASRLTLVDALRAGGRTIAGSGRLFRNVLATGEIAIALMLLAAAGLLVRTLASLNNTDLGYRAEHVVTMSIALPLKGYPSPESALTFYHAIGREISAIPGVRSTAFVTNLPLDGWNIGQGFEVVGEPSRGEANQAAAHYQMASASYFETMGIPILQGRSFTTRDTASSTPVCIVNEELARRHLKGRDPIGARISVQAMDPGGPKPVVREIVGVARQVKVQGPGEREPSMEVYVPLEQNAWFGTALAVRTEGDPMRLVPAIRQAIAGVDKSQPLTRIRTMEEVAAEAVARPRFRAQLVGLFAALALALAVVGVSGVLAFGVTQRTREFGIRMALGARAVEVLTLVMRSAVPMIGIGIVAGLAGAVALTSSLRALLYGVRPWDGLTFMAAAALLCLTALIACSVPAMRASRLDPAVALREE
jgi:putative ABC transport system permease protein